MQTERLIEVITNSLYLGFCTECDTEHEGIEPDACGYECEACGEHAVYGAEELLIMQVP